MEPIPQRQDKLLVISQADHHVIQADFGHQTELIDVLNLISQGTEPDVHSVRWMKHDGRGSHIGVSIEVDPALVGILYVRPLPWR
jgi:hypothetical protein